MSTLSKCTYAPFPTTSVCILVNRQYATNIRYVTGCQVHQLQVDEVQIFIHFLQIKLQW